LGTTAGAGPGGDVVWTSDSQTWVDVHQRILRAAPFRTVRVEQVQAPATDLVFPGNHSSARIAVDSFSNRGAGKGQELDVARQR